MQITEKRQNAPFCGIDEAARRTGLARCFIRAGCKAGTIPHIKSGTRFLVNVPALLQQLGVPEGAMQDGPLQDDPLAPL